MDIGTRIEPELSNDLARRQWQWLCQRVGEARAREGLAAACVRGRRPFPLNVAREIGVQLPAADDLPSNTATAASHLEALRQLVR